MNKLQLYFDYFDKYYNVESWEWYENLSYWVDISQKIKQKIALIDFSKIDEIQTKLEVEKVLIENSNNEIKSIEAFLDRYLFYQDNGLGNIGQGVVWDSDNNPHKTEIKSNFTISVFINLLDNDILKVERTINELLGEVDRNYEAAKFR